MAETNQPGTSAGGVRQLLAYAGPLKRRPTKSATAT